MTLLIGHHGSDFEITNTGCGTNELIRRKERWLQPSLMPSLQSAGITIGEKKKVWQIRNETIVSITAGKLHLGPAALPCTRPGWIFMRLLPASEKNSCSSELHFKGWIFILRITFKQHQFPKPCEEKYKPENDNEQKYFVSPHLIFKYLILMSCIIFF